MKNLKISVKKLLNLLNLLSSCKSISYSSKILNTLNRFNKMPYLLRSANVDLLRVLRNKTLNINKISQFNSSTFF